MSAPITDGVAEAIRTLRLKLDVRKERIWSPAYSFSAEIGEVETLITEVERLRSALTARDELLLELKQYIEKMEVAVAGEWGRGEPLMDLIATGAMPDLYWKLQDVVNGTK